MADRASELAQREYDYLLGLTGADFFLALRPYADTLTGNRRVRRVLTQLFAEMEEAMRREADAHRELLDEAGQIRHDLADAAPEVDNSGMQRPAHPLDDDWMRWDLDSFARFDELAALPVVLRYSPLPNGEEEAGTVGRLMGILRGRLRAAEHGEDTPDGPLIRDDLGDFGRRIGNLARRHEHFVRQHRQDERTLPALAFGRAAAFGTELNPEPTIVESDEDMDRWVNQLFVEYGDPRARVREFVNGAQMDERDRLTVKQIEEKLKLEVERFHQELIRRLSSVPFWQPPLRIALGSAGKIATGVIIGVIIAVIVAHLT